MRRLLIVILFLTISISICYSSSLRLMLGTGNDKFSMGISENDDDGETFDLSATLVDKYWAVSLTLQSWTDRINNLRADRILLGPKLFIEKELKNNFSLNAAFSLLLGCEGNLGLENIQNLNHRLKKIHEVHLPYVKPAFTWHYSFGLIGLYKGNGVLLKLDDNGLWWGFSLDSGLFRFEYTNKIGTTIGFGTILIDALSTIKEPTWEENDIKIIIGKENIQDFDFLSNYLLIILNEKINIYGASKYTSGFPYSEHLSSAQFRVQRNHILTSIGVMFEMLEDVFVSPFCSIGLGYGKFNHKTINTITKTKTSIGHLRTFFIES